MYISALLITALNTRKLLESCKMQRLLLSFRAVHTVEHEVIITAGCKPEHQFQSIMQLCKKFLPVS